jgi:hypothetical protein
VRKFFKIKKQIIGKVLHSVHKVYHKQKSYYDINGGGVIDDDDQGRKHNM